MSDWRSDFVESNGIRLHYTRTGGDKPPMVLAHGVTDAGPCWSRVAEALTSEFDVVMVDARGHGRSDAPERGYGPQDQAADLAGVISALGLRRPAILGHSMGAATALVLAGMEPDMPGSILLEDPPSWWTGWYASTDGEERRAQMRERALGLQRTSRDALIVGQRAEQPGWVDGELEPWADAKLQFSPNVLKVFDAGNPSGVDWSTVLRRITCPILLIRSDPELGGIVTEQSAAVLREYVPHLEIAQVPEAGHSIRRDQFDRFMAVVRGYLAANQCAVAG